MFFAHVGAPKSFTPVRFMASVGVNVAFNGISCLPVPTRKVLSHARQLALILGDLTPTVFQMSPENLGARDRAPEVLHRADNDLAKLAGLRHMRRRRRRAPRRIGVDLDPRC